MQIHSECVNFSIKLLWGKIWVISDLLSINMDVPEFCKGHVADIIVSWWQLLRVFMVKAPGFAQWVLSSSVYKGPWSLGISINFWYWIVIARYDYFLPLNSVGGQGTKQLTKPSGECVCVCVCTCVCVSLLRSAQEERRYCLVGKEDQKHPGNKNLSSPLSAE